MNKSDLLAKYLVKVAAAEKRKNMIKIALLDRFSKLLQLIKDHPWRSALIGTSSVGGGVGGFLLGRRLARGSGGKEGEGGGTPQQLQLPPKVMPSTIYEVSDEELGKLLKKHLLQSKK